MSGRRARKATPLLFQWRSSRANSRRVSLQARWRRLSNRFENLVRPQWRFWAAPCKTLCTLFSFSLSLRRVTICLITDIGVVGAVRARTRFVESRHLYDLSATYVANSAAFQPICRKSGPHDRRGACACFNMKNNRSSVLFFCSPSWPLEKKKEAADGSYSFCTRRTTRGVVSDHAEKLTMLPICRWAYDAKRRAYVPTGVDSTPRVPYGNARVTNRDLENQD